MFTYFFNFLLSATLSPAFQGGLWTLAGLALCFLTTHLILFFKNAKKNTPPTIKEEPTQKKEQAPAPQEPVYYIVEKKRRRPKHNYGVPKEIRFR